MTPNVQNEPMGQMISFNGGGTDYHGYLAQSVNGRGKGVIVLQEWWGLVGHIKSVADRFAEAGFTALAPDLFQGKTTTEPDEAGSLLMALNIAETEKILNRAVKTLLSQDSVEGEKVGVIGFCMGGQLSLFAATTNDEIGACVNFYGIHPNVKPNYANLRGPVLGVFAEHDDYASPAAVAQMDAEMTAAGKPHEFHTYPGVHHAFFNDGRPTVYNEVAAKDAWAKTLAFLNANL